MGWYRREFDDVLGPDSHILQHAFYEALASCSLAQNDNSNSEVEDFLAKEIVAAARQGERDPEAITKHVLNRLAAELF